MDGHERTNPAYRSEEREILRSDYWEQRCQLAEELLKHVFTNKEIGRACHIHDLEEKSNAYRMKSQIKEMLRNIVIVN